MTALFTTASYLVALAPLFAAAPLLIRPTAPEPDARSLQGEEVRFDGLWHETDGTELELSAPLGARGSELTGTLWTGAAKTGARFAGFRDGDVLGGSALVAQGEVVALAGRLERDGAEEVLRVQVTRVQRPAEGSAAAVRTIPLELRRGPAADRLEVTVHGIEPQQGGSFRGFLHDSKKTFPLESQGVPYAAAVDVRADTVTVVFEGVARGQYAFVGFHDKNDNGKIDRKLFRPAEGLTASGERKSRPPRFEDCLLTVGRGTTALILEVTYP